MPILIQPFVPLPAAVAVFHRLVGLKKCRTRLLQESDASIRDSYTSMVSFKERYPELILQFSHATTDCGLPDTQDGRNTTKTQVLADEERLTH